MTEQPESLVAAATGDGRAFNRQTRRAILPNECIPAPDAYRILATAAELAYAMPQALAQLGEALRRLFELGECSHHRQQQRRHRCALGR